MTELHMTAIARSPDLSLDLLALIIEEGAKKRPDDNTLSAFGFLLGHALEEVRYAGGPLDPMTAE